MYIEIRKVVKKEKKESETMITKILNLIHMARKAGKVVFGYDATMRSCQSNGCKLLICAEDLASKQVKRLQTVVDDFDIKMIQLGKKEEFGREFKLRDVGIISIEDSNFAKGILKLVNK